MALDARTAVFERIELLWKPALRTPERVDRSTILIGWHCYEMEASFECADCKVPLLKDPINNAEDIREVNQLASILA